MKGKLKGKLKAKSTQGGGVLVILLAVAGFAVWALAAVLWSGAFQPAQAHDLGADSVYPDPNGGRVVWQEFVRYDGAVDHASFWWDELNCRWGSSCPGVSLFRDTPGGATRTLEIYEYSNCESSVIGTWQDSPDPDRILLNSCLMGREDMFNKRSVTTHEFGHGLRFSHPPSTSYYKENSIMFSCPTCTRYNTPRPHDDNDYFNTWVN